MKFTNMASNSVGHNLNLYGLNEMSAHPSSKVLVDRGTIKNIPMQGSGGILYHKVSRDNVIFFFKLVYSLCLMHKDNLCNLQTFLH